MSDLSILQMTRKELENHVGSLKEQHLQDAADFKTLLRKAENQAKDVQKEYEMTQQEKQSITDELKKCKDNLKLLGENGNNKPWPWMPMLAALAVVTAMVLYAPGLARASP